LDETPQKRVDESWKSEVAKERQQFHRGRAGAGPEPPAEAETDSAFAQFLLGLRVQALIALGQVPHPLTQQPEPQPEQAQYLIETLALLQRKTKGNLSREETSLLEEVLYELRMKFVELTQPPPAVPPHA
jgi:hypothetical protein